MEDGFVVPADSKVLAMSKKINEETALLEGDRTPNWHIDVTQMLIRVARKSGCHEEFSEAVIKEDSHTKCCPGRNDKLKKTYGRTLMFILKLFRFPALRHEFQIKSVINCKHQFNVKSRDVCLNPWHYRFVDLEHVNLAPIVVDKDGDYGLPPKRSDDAFEEHMEWERNRAKQLERMEHFHMPNVTMQGDEIRLLYDRLGANGSEGSFAYPVLQGNVTPFFVEEDSSASSSDVTITDSKQSSTASSPAQPIIFMGPNGFHSGLSSPSSSTTMLFPNGTNENAMEQDQPVDSDLTPIMETDQNGNNGISNPTFSDGSPIEPIEPRPLFRSSPAELGELVRRGANVECVAYQENPYWLKIMYYEENKKIGAVEQFCSHHVLIDGFSSSSEKLEPGHNRSRFSIGFYTNPNRADVTEDVRAIIGKGVRLFLLGGEVYIENLGTIPVFIQSICANLKNGFQLNTVTKLLAGGSMKVFDMRMFSKKLAQAAMKTYQDVHCLSRMCTIRLSFCKGWGQHYSRDSVLRAPVWFQVHLNNPMEWIDSVLNCMGAPPRICSSRT